MKLVILWTDYFVYALAIAALLLILKISRDPNLRRLWKKILYRPLNLVAAMVLLTFATIGFLDSIHIQTKVTVNDNSSKRLVSVLDLLLSPIAFNTEKTYSAPFATKSFSKESITLENGELIRDYPRLEYAGKHLSSSEAKQQDVRENLFRAMLIAAILWGAFSILWLMVLSLKHKVSIEVIGSRLFRGGTLFPWRTFLGFSFFLFFLISILFIFMPLYHIFGTSQVGVDVLYQTLKSIRTGLIIGTVTTLVTLPFAALFGIMAAYFKGWVDDAIQYVYTTLSSIPGVLLIAAAVLTLQIVMDRHQGAFQTVIQRSDARLLALCAILGITSWTVLCRLLRGETLKICEMDYVSAARTMGVTHLGIIFRHILPNVMHIILITIALDFSGLVLAEAVLSYVGVGVDPSTYSWGTMINSARLELARVPVIWWSLTAAFIFMFVLVLAANVFADALRDAFDPRTIQGNPS